jgi:hypothetical protein
MSQLVGRYIASMAKYIINQVRYNPFEGKLITTEIADAYEELLLHLRRRLIGVTDPLYRAVQNALVALEKK